MKNLCPLCNIDVKNEEYKSVSQRNVVLLIIEYRKLKESGSEISVSEKTGCPLCGANFEDIEICKRKNSEEN